MACLRNGLKQRVLILNHIAVTKSHEMPVWVIKGSPLSWWKGLALLLPSVELFPHLVCSSPLGWLCRDSAAPVIHKGVEQSRSSTRRIERLRECYSSAGHPHGQVIASDKRHFMCIINNNNGPATRKGCAVHTNSHWECFRTSNHGRAARSCWWHCRR